jgi:PmbA protein
MPASLDDLTDALLGAAKAAGAQAADVMVVRGISTGVGVRDGKLEEAERAEGIDLGLRVLMGQRQACVSASDSAPATMAAMAERAVAMALEAPEDPTIGLADASQLATTRDARGLDLNDDGPEPTADALRDAALACEAAARDVDGISQIDQCGAGYSARDMAIAATNGFRGGYARSSHSLSCVAITGTGTGMERDYFGDMRVHRSDLMDAREIGRIAAERTLARAGARQPKTGQFPVLFDERVASSLIGHLISAINGSAIARGASWLRDAVGQSVLPDGIDLIEDPHRARISGSRLFDAEGLPTARRAVVENGVLTGWVLDLSTGRKLGMPSTANARRSPASPPSPGAGNLMLTPGDADRAALMAQMGTGLLVTSMIGATINPTTGDYSRGAAGLWVENGAPAYAVNECTIAGNLRDMLRAIVPANDARAHLSRVVPSLLVEGMTIAGA